MTAHLIELTNPFRPSIQRKTHLAFPGHSIRKNLTRRKFIVNGKRVAPFVVTHNGKVLLEKQWGLRVRDGDVVTVQHLPKGGRGSNPLQIILMIAIVVASVYTGGAAGAAYGAAAGAAAAAAVSIGGAMLLSIMFPQSNQLGLASSSSSGSASPTYSLSPSGNTARILQSIPVLYGREKITPDFAAQPYTEMQGDNQYLYQLFMLTQGEMDINQILIGDTDISTYDGIQTEVIGPYQPVTLFPTNVVTSTEVASQILKGTNDETADRLGPFVASAAGTISNYIAVDISIPQGLFRIDDSGKNVNATCSYRFDYRPIDDSGNPTTPVWNTLVANSMTSASRDAIRITHKVQLPPGRYQVRGVRTNIGSTDGRTSDTLYWDGLKAYLTAPTNYGNCTMLAIIMKATNQLSTSSTHNINVIGTRRLQTWDPVNGWSLTTSPTQNPAHAAADILRNSDYGRGMVDSKYDLLKLYQLAQTFDSRGDTFNYYYDTKIQLWSALQLCLRVGRTVPVYYAGLISFIRNEPQSIPRQMYQPDNMMSGSFSTTYQFAEVDTPDFVRIQFRNEQTWSDDSVDCILPGATATKPSEIQLPGCTDRAHAWREGMTMAAMNKLQRRTIQFTTELEGMLPQYNDLCKISHDVVEWGFSGRVYGLNSNTGLVTLSENVTFNPGETHVISFRKKDGSADGPFTCVANPNGDPNEVILTGVTSSRMAQIYISDSSHDEPTQYQFGPVGRDGLLAVMYSAQPQGDGTVTLTFVNYDANVFAAETGGIIPEPVPPSNLPRPPQLPIIDKVSLEYTYSVGRQTIVCTAANGASYYEFQVSPDNGSTWIKVGNNTNPQLDVSLTPQHWLIRARGVGTLAGPWTTISVDVQATTLPLSSIGALTTTSLLYGIRIDWNIQANNGGMPDNVELWHGLSNQLGNAVLLITVPETILTYSQMDMGPGERHYYWARVIDKAGRPGPWFNNGIGIVGESSSDAGKLLDYLAGQIDETQLAQSLQEKIDSGGGAATEITQINDKINAMILLKAQGVAPDGTPVLAGIGIGVESGASDIILMANRVSISDPSNNATRKYPFIVVGGVVYMDTAMIRDGTINTAKIGDAQITNAKIADASISTAKIGNAQITNALIADAQINSAKIQDGAITTAKIGDAQINTAKIGFAQIDTLRIAAGAVTIGNSFSGTNTVNVNFNTTGGIVTIVFGGNAPSTRYTLNIDGGPQAIFETGLFSPGYGIWSGPLSAGTHNLTLNGGGACRITTLEFQR
jgi:predicted phage tail protein